MQYLKFIPAIALPFIFAFSCNGPSSKQSSADQAAKQKAADPAGSLDQLIDTAKLKSDMNNIMNSIATGKPDTAALKKAASDVLTTTANVLSDSGISKLGGDGDDPAQKNATEALKKMRDGLGITPGALDSMKKSAAQLHDH
jgi:hypothetical protein